MSLVEVLPVDPVTPITFAPSSWRQRLASAPSAAVGIVDHEDVCAARPACSPAVDDHPQAPCSITCCGERAAVDVLAGDPEEEVARAGLARVDHARGRDGCSSPPAIGAAPIALGDLPGG